MPHLKCVACGTRLYSAGGADALVIELVGNRCPRCGATLIPVNGFSEAVASQTIRPHEDLADASPRYAHQRYAGRVRDLFAGRTVLDAQTWLDAERWLDDGGNVRAEAPIPDGVKTTA